jgi:hypothetical protein
MIYIRKSTLGRIGIPMDVSFVIGMTILWLAFGLCANLLGKSGAKFTTQYDRRGYAVFRCILQMADMYRIPTILLGIVSLLIVFPIYMNEVTYH